MRVLGSGSAHEKEMAEKKAPHNHHHPIAVEIDLFAERQSTRLWGFHMVCLSHACSSLTILSIAETCALRLAAHGQPAL